MVNLVSHTYFEQLYRQYNEALRQYCLTQFNYSSAYADMVDDVVHDVFVKAYREIDRLRRHPNPMGWLCVTCRNICRSSIRRDLRRREIIEEHAPLSNYSLCCDDVLRWAESREDQEALESLKRTLSSHEAGVYRLFYEEQYSAAEVAEMTGMSQSAVRGVLKRIRSKALHHHFLLAVLLFQRLAELLRGFFMEGGL